jgi:hypothetical protein
VDERSYLRVANCLTQFGLWTSWCSQFLKPAGFHALGMAHLERMLKREGWPGGTLVLHEDVDPGGGFGYGHVLVDEALHGTNPRLWQKAVRDHLEEHHRGYLLDGKRSHCVTAVLVR